MNQEWKKDLKIEPERDNPKLVLPRTRLSFQQDMILLPSNLISNSEDFLKNDKMFCNTLILVIHQGNSTKIKEEAKMIEMNECIFIVRNSAKIYEIRK